MKGQLLKVLERQQLVDMIYIDKSNKISKRRIKITKIDNDTFKAYCFSKHASRTFIIENVLALLPVISKEREVV